MYLTCFSVCIIMSSYIWVESGVNPQSIMIVRPVGFKARSLEESQGHLRQSSIQRRDESSLLTPAMLPVLKVHCSQCHCVLWKNDEMYTNYR